LITVLVVDDQPYFRGVLRKLISASPGFLTIGEATSGEEAITAVATMPPDLVLMDVRLPGIDGFQAAVTLLERDSPPFIVLISGSRIELPPALATRREAVVFTPKDELSPRRLLDLWRERGGS
jgi:DNA-binding NarL/FixJ family response regulator